MAIEVNYDDHSHRVYIAVGFAIGITYGAILFRLLARRVQKVPSGADDFVIIPGAATYAGYQTYAVAITRINVSILLFYHRIFTTPQFRLRTNIVGALVILWLLLNNFMAAFQCRPIKKTWIPLTPGHCIEPLGLIVGLQAGNIVLDITILALPVHAVSKLQTSLAKKGFTGVDSWTAVEPAIEVLSVSLPVMAPFLQARRTANELRTIFRSLLSISKKSDSNNDEGFREINERNKIDFEHNGHGGRMAFATTERHTSQRSDLDDTIPLHAIKVTDQVDVC
ncbi:MAG: hypothetical protein Q9166_006328 [cf. Caloplaca sp. 2 TL-2023]